MTLTALIVRDLGAPAGLEPAPPQLVGNANDAQADDPNRFIASLRANYMVRQAYRPGP
jgi:hypothetical protein